MPTETLERSRLERLRSIFISAANVPDDVLNEIMESYMRDEPKTVVFEIMEGQLSLSDVF